MRHRRLCIATLLCVALLAVIACHPSGSRDSRPLGTIDDVMRFAERDDTNVLFVLIDTLRADHLSAYGYDRETSPVIDQLADSGVRFAHNVSQSSWTKCSMASLWTGIYPSRTGVLRAPHVLSDDAKLPAEIFREAGFRTAGIWRNGWIAPNFGFGQGFEVYTQPKPSPRDRPKTQQAPNVTLPGSDTDIIRSTHAFLRAHGHERWFAYLHLMDVHQYVYSADEALFGTTYLDIYDNSIRWVDGLIGHLVGELEDRGLREKTLIVIASDHGEAFGEHGSEGHARDIYGEVTETPVVLSFPFRLETGIVVDTRTANVDVWPTVLELVGLPGLDDPDGSSRLADVVAAANGATADPAQDGRFFAELDETWGRSARKPQPLVAVNEGRWRLVYPSVRPNQAQLFDKHEDPAEQRDLATEHPEVVEQLVGVVEKHKAGRPPPWGETQSIELDEMELNQLRALGYGVQ